MMKLPNKTIVCDRTDCISNRKGNCESLYYVFNLLRTKDMPRMRVVGVCSHFQSTYQLILLSKQQQLGT